MIKCVFFLFFIFNYTCNIVVSHLKRVPMCVCVYYTTNLDIIKSDTG